MGSKARHTLLSALAAGQLPCTALAVHCRRCRKAGVESNKTCRSKLCTYRHAAVDFDQPFNIESRLAEKAVDIGRQQPAAACKNTLTSVPANPRSPTRLGGCRGSRGGGCTRGGARPRRRRARPPRGRPRRPPACRQRPPGGCAADTPRIGCGSRPGHCRRSSLHRSRPRRPWRPTAGWERRRVVPP